MGSFRSEFADYMSHLICITSNVVILGDFNVHWENDLCPDSKCLRDLVESTSCIQHVAAPTHIDGHTLDLVISRTSDDLVSSVCVGTHITDHSIVKCSLIFRNHSIEEKYGYQEAEEH